MGGRRKFRNITMCDVPRQGVTPHDLVEDDDETEPPSQPLDTMHDDTLVQETEMGSDIGMATKTTSTRLGRGATKIHKQWNTGKKFEVEWNTTNKVVTGKDSAAVTSCVGILARNTFRFPLKYPSYTNVPKLDILWTEIQENTNLPMEANYYVLKDFGNAWKAWKCKVKKMYFKPNRDNPDLLELCPPIMDTEQWKELVEYWLRDDIEKISEKNARNQKLNLFPHRTGRTSFDVIINELEKVLA
ncbi:hypothetical protein LIER_02062 [Lithospermum erythrorhizon]|uniref:Uncharacterized protein n=1 Tax=Lithospermum erythrorhizon TaxID=34254 RepID=A0AAV3NPL8_LITER